MKNEQSAERQERYLELAEKAYDLWGRILDAKMEFIYDYSPPLRRQTRVTLRPIFEYEGDNVAYAPGQPPEIGPPPKVLKMGKKRIEEETAEGRLQKYDDEVQHARQLFDLVLAKVDEMPAPGHTKPTVSQEAVPQHPAPKKPAKRFHATTRSNEEIAGYTTSIMEKMTADLDSIHGTYSFEKIEQAKKKEFAAGKTTLHVSTGGKIIEQEVRNRFIIVQDDLSQAVLWLAQAGGPRYAPFLQLPADRISFTLAKINLGKPADNHMDGETLWGYIDEAVEQRLLTDNEDPKITVEGLEHIGERLAQDQALVEDRPLLLRA